MTVAEKLIDLKERADKNARDCIFPFWTSESILDKENGGFYGKVTRYAGSQRGAPLACPDRAYGICVFKCIYAVQDDVCLERAKRAFDYLEKYFYDPEFGGAYSTVSYKGEVIDDNKPTYAESFLIMTLLVLPCHKGSESIEIALSPFISWRRK